MKRSLFKTFLFALTLVFSSFVYNASANANNYEIDPAKLVGEFNIDSTDLQSVIIELDEPSIIEAKHAGKTQTREHLEVVRGQIFDTISAKTNATIGQEYDYVFSGFSVTLPGTDIMELLNVPGIKAVYPNVHYQAMTVEMPMTAEEFVPNMTASNPYVGAPEAWSMGYTGAGMTVAVIDSGVDYNHPELAHAFGEYKGYDFVDNDGDPMETMDENGEYVTSHGTHVSGTIAAFSFGIAPEARLLGYRVLGPNGGSSDQVMAGIQQAVIDGADVMNLSLGNDLNDPDYATSIALDWAMAEGVVAVTSNGNNGPYNWTVGAPGASREAISVGSTALPTIEYTRLGMYTSDAVTYESLKVMGTNSVEAINALDGETYEFVFAGLGSNEEFEGIDVEGKVALIMRGNYAFVDKVKNAKEHGAVAAVIFNNVAGEINTSGEFVLPTFQLTFDDGYNMYVETFYGNNTVTFDVNGIAIGETISDFSSRGPAFSTWMIKPDVSAPGDWIISAYPGGMYAYSGGTSMASPHVAAAAALILQAHPEYTPEDVKAAIMNTAEKLIDPLTGEYYPHNTQGAGSLRIVDAINADTLVTPGSHSFGKFIKDNGKQVETQKIEIKNFSNETKRYTFEANFEGNPDGIKVMTGSNTQVKSNSTQEIQFNVQVDTNKLAPGYYEGTITISDGEKTIVVPTILFVQEPDYPRVTLASTQPYEEGTYLAYGYLPAGAEYAQISFYTFDEVNGAIGEYLGTPFSATDLEPGYYIELWDGTVNGVKLEPGQYVIVVHAVYLGQTDYAAGLIEVY